MPETVSLDTFLDMLYAIHLSSYVQMPVEDRGGLMMVGPPGILKTSLLEVLDRRYSETLMLTDLNVQTFVKHVRDRLAAQVYRTMLLPELPKLYERNVDTANNMEGILRSLMAEGFRYASFENPNAAGMIARCLVMGAMPPSLYRAKLQHWEDSGFARRVLFCHFDLENPKALEQALDRNVRVGFREGVFPPEPQGAIPNMTTPAERRDLTLLLKHQPGPHATQKALLVRATAVLRWWYPMIGRKAAEAFPVVREWTHTLAAGGARLTLDLSDGQSERSKRWRGRGRKRSSR